MTIPVQDTPRRKPQTGRILTIAALAIVSILAYRDLIGPNIFPKRFHEVVPGQLYRSGKLTPAALTSVVRAHDIKTIVDLGAWPEGSAADRREARTAAALGVDRIRLPDVRGDSTGDVNTYVEALRIINDPGRRPVLVHCGAGTERTGCVVALYRMFEDGWTLEKAYDEAKSAGHSPSRNPKLRETLEAWTEPIRDALVTGGKVEAPAADTPGQGG